MPCPVRMRGPECLGRDGACVQYAEEMRRHDEPGSEVAESTTCQAADSGAGKCKTAMCNVWIGGKDHCSECATAGEHLVDGKCVAANSDTKCTSNSAGACSSCAQGYFLHRGGCYKIGGTVGLLICDDKTATAGKDGICVTCHEGYFKNPASATDKTKESCIACNQTAAIDRYQGVDKCAARDSSQLPSSGGGTAKCTKCQGTDYLKSDGTACGEKTSTCVSDTEFAKEDAANGNKCVSCGDEAAGVAGCNTCTYDSGTKKVACTECTDKYLKTVDGATTCVEKTACKDDYFPVDDSSNGNKCVSCGDTDAGVPNCAKCTLSSGVTKPTCSERGSGFKLEGGACVPAGTNLSTGAIAGISVAAVVVVGGLVGFLCWWFICRGKA